MDKFIKEYFFVVLYSLQAITVIVAILSYKKFKNSSTKYLIWFLIYIIFEDLLANYRYVLSEYYVKLLENSPFSFDYLWLIYNPIFFLFYSYKLTKWPWMKKVIPYVVVVFLITTIFYSYNNWEDLSGIAGSYVQVFSFLIILFVAFLYYIELLVIDVPFLFFESVRFYALTANFIWWLIITPISIFDLYYSELDEAFDFLRWRIYFSANLIYFTMYSVGLLVSKNE